MLADPVIKTLYEASKGITALVVTIFFLAQRRAIVSRIEDLTKNVIESALHDNQHFVSQVLAQLKEGSQSSSNHRNASDLGYVFEIGSIILEGDREALQKDAIKEVFLGVKAHQ